MTRARRLRGRTLIFGGAMLFVLLSTVVVWRRGQGVALARQMRLMQDSLRMLGVEHADLARDIRQASARARILDAGRALGLRAPADSQVRTLPRAPGRETLADTSAVGRVDGAH
ncbi:MAG: hypothetical protein MUE41_17165 [Gemmatimonadaceae bacterium]|jgi:hypothetical protein|nr:hypothetical protein [Gemmatimonadaceae bacterium]